MSSFHIYGRPNVKVRSVAAFARSMDIVQTIFEYIGQVDQAVIVPVGQTSIIVKGYGASSSSDSTLAGRGAYAKFEITGLMSGQMLIARVAGMASGGGGWIGGGNAGAAGYTGSRGAGGGGVTVLMKAPYSFPIDVILAVPGGGGEAVASTSGAPAHGRGGDGDMVAADDGQMANGWSGGGDPTGQGATNLLNGPASGAGGGTAGTDYLGGNGSSTNVSGIGSSSAGGGGGGAKAGGGGGATFVINGHAAGGGGGAGFFDAAHGVTLLESTRGGRLGHGRLILIGPSSVFPPTTLSTTFSYTGAAQSFTVPSGVTSVVVELRGAKGGGTGGGKGSYIRFRMPVTPGQTIGVYVGGQGQTFNGGGTCRWTGVGGGATDVRVGGSAVANRVAVAGGGGGEGNGANLPGGAAGLLSGEGAWRIANADQASRSTWYGNGAAWDGNPGVNEIGGPGGGSGYSIARDGGGGGGGYKAGAGGGAGNGSNSGGGGGGGCGWISSVCYELEYIDNTVVGNGSCIIRW